MPGKTQKKFKTNNQPFSVKRMDATISSHVSGGMIER